MDLIQRTTRKCNLFVGGRNHRRENVIFSPTHAFVDENMPSSRWSAPSPTRKRIFSSERALSDEKTHLLVGARILRRENAFFSSERASSVEKMPISAQRAIKRRRHAPKMLNAGWWRELHSGCCGPGRAPDCLTGTVLVQSWLTTERSAPPIARCFRQGTALSSLYYVLRRAGILAQRSASLEMGCRCRRLQRY